MAPTNAVCSYAILAGRNVARTVCGQSIKFACFGTIADSVSRVDLRAADAAWNEEQQVDPNAQWARDVHSRDVGSSRRLCEF
jgi:hypothetical protein